VKEPNSIEFGSFYKEIRICVILIISI